MKKLSILFILAAVSLISWASADKVILKSGNEFDCVILQSAPTIMVIEIANGTIKLNPADVMHTTMDTPDNNLIIRGDFMKGRNKLDEAMRFYQEAMIANAKNLKARQKYDDLYRAQEKVENKAAVKLTEKVDTHATEENLAAMHDKELPMTGNTSITAEGFGMFPLYGAKKGKDDKALTAAKVDALRKVFTKGTGYGWSYKGGKTVIMPVGELPNVNIKILTKEKTSVGYRVMVQISGPSSSVFVDYPTDYPSLGMEGINPKLKAADITELRQGAIERALQEGVAIAISRKINEAKANPKGQYFGRVFVEKINNELLTGTGYYIQLSTKLWIDPACSLK